MTAGSQHLRQAMDGFRRYLLLTGMFSMVINLLMLTAPIYMLQVFDRVLQSRSLDTLLFLTIAAVAALATLAVLEAVRSFLFIQFAHWLESYLGPVFLSLNMQQALRQGGAAGLSRLRDISAIRNFLTGTGLPAFLDAPWTPIYLAVIFFLHENLGALALTGSAILVLLAFANEVVTRRALMASGDAQRKADIMVDAILRNADAVAAMGMSSGVIGHWRVNKDAALDDQSAASRRGALIVAMAKFFRFLLQVGILGTGAYLVLQNELSAGGMIAASILVGRALAPVDSAIASWKNGVNAQSAWARLKQVHAMESGVEKQEFSLPQPESRLEVTDLLFFYPGQAEAGIKRVSFRLAAGEVLGVIGPSAAGKSTLARLLVGNLAPRSGHVRLDGIDMASWDEAQKGRHVGYVPQGVELFAGTVQQNIARMGEVDEGRVIRAAQAAGVHEMILALPQGYDTEIGEGGAVLSGGQRQRLALARALYGDPYLLVYDEPNASLDHAGEEAFSRTLMEAKERGAVQVIISHKPNILRLADRILVLQNGAVQALGEREQIIAELMRLQNQQARPITSEASHD